MDIKNRKKAIVPRLRLTRSWPCLLVILSVLHSGHGVLGHLDLSAENLGALRLKSEPDVFVGDPLFPEQHKDRDLSDGQVHSYQLELSAGSFLRVDFHSTNLDLIVSLAEPGGRRPLDWMVPRRVSTPISWIAGATGSFLLTVRNVDQSEDHGVYRLVTWAPRKAAAQDRKLVAASRALSDATQLRRQWTRRSLTAAISRYEEALGCWQAMADPSQEAATLKNIGDVWEILSEQLEALDSFRKAQSIYRELKDRNGEARTLNAISAAYISRGEFQKALKICAQELPEIDDPWQKAQSLHNLGAAYYGTNEMQKAVNFLNKALRLRQTLQDRSGQAETLLYLGYVNHAIKDIGETNQYYRRSLKFSRAARDPRAEALALTALGHLSNISGDRQEAVDYYDQSARMFETIGDLVGQIAVLEGQAYLYSGLGHKETALQYFLEALTLARRAKDVVAEANTLDYVGGIYRDLGDYSSALKYSQQSVLVNQSISSILGESYALATLGTVFEALGNEDSAEESYARALELSRKGGDRFLEGLLLNAFGHLRHALGQLSEARSYYQHALSLQQEANDSVRLPSTLYNFARLERDRGNLDQAIQFAEQALKINESLRGKVASQELRGSLMASVHQQYELTIDLRMRQHVQHPAEGFDAQALQASERARARSLLDLLTEARIDIRQGIEPDLLERERTLRGLLNGKAVRQASLLSGKYDAGEADALAKEIGDIITRYEQIQGQIRSRSPRYAALTQPQPLSLTKIQQQVLDRDTLLLEYALDDERSYLWAIDNTSMTSYQLPGRAQIEEQARRVYDLLVTRQKAMERTSGDGPVRIAEAEAQFWQDATVLSQTLLGPVADQLGTKRLLIVSEGVLQYLPFGALPKPRTERKQEREQAKDRSQKCEGSEKTAEGGRPRSEEPWAEAKDDVVPLMVEHEIVNLPSASVMAVLRRETLGRALPPKTVFVLADPVFENDDPRVRPEASRKDMREQIAASTPEQLRSLSGVHLLRDSPIFSRLPSTRLEAQAIMAIVPPEEGMLAAGFNASRATATSGDLSQYRIIHFATHGVLDSEQPGLSGIVLSMVDEQGRQQDGFLRLHDIYNLNLPVDLVVLSACSTGLGKQIRGEGLVGLVRGFLYAGAARVVASLWKVDDDATAELMKRFYRHMLQKNLPAAAALRAAQVEMWQQKQWQSPYYWAAFTLQGEWK